ncbi:MAG TPA: hypothetical protein GX505_10750 [Clostridiales bacterium]|nr:hypothetical protein [Clostridiales bacterium]
MKPDPYEEDFLVIDGSLDSSIFPPGISHGLNVLSPDDHDHYSIDGYDDYPEIDFNEFKDHI